MRFSGFRLILVTLLSLCFLGIQSRAQALSLQKSISTTEYWQRVDSTLSTLRSLTSKPESAVAPALDKLADEWSQITGITNPPTKLDTSPLVNELRQRPYNLQTLIQRFNDLKNVISPTRKAQTQDLNHLDTILQRPEFDWDKPPSPLEEMWNQFWDRVFRWLESLRGNSEVNVPVPSDAIPIIAGVVLLLILLYVFRGLFKDFFIEASAKDEQMAGDELLTAESALQKAKDISRGGDYRTAVRYLYISSLLTLDERGIMRFERYKTNREYLRSVVNYPQLSIPLREVIDVFDRVWYGFQPLDQESFEHYVEKVDQLREQKK